MPPKAAAPPATGASAAAPAPGAQPGGCVHFNKASPFFLEKNVVPKAFSGRVKCGVCFAIGVRAALNATRIQVDKTGILVDETGQQVDKTGRPVDEKDKKVPESVVLTAEGPGAGIDSVAFEAGLELWHTEGFTKAPLIANKTPQFSVQPPPGLTPITFESISGENGETYHALISAAMTHAVKVNVEKASEGQKMLLRNYLKPETFATTVGGNKGDATNVIAQTWLQTERSGEQQLKMFASIRDFINDQELTALTAEPLIQATPSYLAKVWIDAVFRASGQSPAGIPPLPAADDRAAVIYVRKQLDTKATDGRYMENPVIGLCFNAIAEANLKGTTERGTPNQHPQPFKIVILYGDVDSSSQAVYQKMAEASVTNTAKTLNLPDSPAVQFKVYLLSNPFSETEKNAKVTPIWNQFRKSIYNDRCPKEVKALAFYLALRDVYQEHMICIGFRSGTLDGAGFLGIPICYFDNTSLVTDPATNKSTKPPPADPRLQGPGGLDYLWDMRAYPGGAKSFAHPPPDLQKPTNTVVFIPTAAILAQAERIEALTMTGDPFIRIQTAAVAPSPADQTALAEALLVYGCLTGSDGRPLWTKRIYLMTSHYDMLESLAANSFGKPEPNAAKKNVTAASEKKFKASTGKEAPVLQGQPPKPSA